MRAKTAADSQAVSVSLVCDGLELTDSMVAPVLCSDVEFRVARLSAAVMSSPDDEEDSLGKYLPGRGRCRFHRGRR